MHKVVLLVFVVTAFASVGCRPTDPLSRSIVAAVNAGAGTRVILADYTGFGWDRVCNFGPYTADSEVDRISGIQGAASRAYDIRENDGIDVLMFIEGQRVVASVAHSR